MWYKILDERLAPMEQTSKKRKLKTLNSKVHQKNLLNLNELYSLS